MVDTMAKVLLVSDDGDTVEYSLGGERAFASGSRGWNVSFPAYVNGQAVQVSGNIVVKGSKNESGAATRAAQAQAARETKDAMQVAKLESTIAKLQAKLPDTRGGRLAEAHKAGPIKIIQGK